MNSFLDAVRSYPFLQYALLTGFLTSIACGIVGSYVVTRRIGYVAGSISHCVLGGMGAARYFNVVWGWSKFQVLYGALISAILAAAVIGWVSLKFKEREDTIIGALWAIGMALGILFISKTPGYNEDLMSYLFGNILMASPADIKLIVLLDLLAILLSILFYNQLLAVCFDEEFAKLRGIKVEFYYILLLCLVALTVVLLIMVVGIIMVIALLTLPAAIAGYFSKALKQMMVYAILINIFFSTFGLVISYHYDLPAGATIIVLAGSLYLVVLIAGRFVKNLKRY